MDVYSPELITAQHEYLIATKGRHEVAGGGLEAGASMERLAESALQRLRNWDIAEIELQRLQREGKIRQYITLRSKANGLVLEKPSIEGKRFMPGEVLYQIADLSNVWILADVFERDIGMVHPGQKTTIRVDAYPDKIFNGEVAFVYPTVTPETRTAIVRIKIPNPDGLLKPAMYARVEFASAPSKDKVLTVSDSAVLDTGIRQVVLVDLGAGRFEPRTVKLGMHADGYAEVRGGLQAGEKVVVKANFLIDAESNIKSALSGFAQNAQDSIASRTTHRGEGTIKAIDFAHAAVTLVHGPIASLQWPAMTMDFRFLEPAVLQSLKPGQKIIFEIVEESAGEFVIVHIQSADASPAASNHGGH
jgi:Cu(I)/Ag(I) efflux system membrane fusion protein